MEACQWHFVRRACKVGYILNVALFGKCLCHRAFNVSSTVLMPFSRLLKKEYLSSFGWLNRNQ